MNVRRVLVAIILLLVGCHREVPRGSSTTPVFIISIDTLRSDHLPAYGYKGVETPNIDALRADSVLFERAYTHCPLTLPAHASLFTGKVPADTGIRDNIGFQLAPGVPTLAELLKRGGYATGAAVSAFVMRAESGIGRGFDFYDDDIDIERPDTVMGRIQRDGAETADIAKRWIALQKQRPIFFFLHLYEPHTPYEPPDPHRSRYASRYDGEIARADEIVGNFLQFLKDSGLYEKSLIILLSDHGEGLNEHGEEEHGIFLYREALQVPLIVKLPDSRLKGASVPEPVQLIDIFPTVLRQTALDQKSTTGIALQNFLESKKPGPRTIYSETYYSRFHFGWSDLHSLIDHDYHYIHAPKPELYDLDTDPSEKSNVLAGTRRVFASMKRTIEPFIKAANAPSAVDTEEAAKLAALGYLGSIATADAAEELPDPKDRLGEFAQIRTVFTLSQKGDHLAVVEGIDRVLESNRKIVDLWGLKSRSLARLGRTEEAIEAAKEGLRLHPNATYLAAEVAKYSLDIGRNEEAEKHADLLLKADPGQAHDILARVWLARRDFDRAEKEAKTALEYGQDRATSLMTLGRIDIERGDSEKALTRFDEALAIARQKKRAGLTNLNFSRGDALARLGRNSEAEAAFREEIRLFPQEPHAYRNLILLLVTEGKIDDGTRLIYDLVKEAPVPPSYIAIVQTLKTVGDDRGARYWARKGLERFPNDMRLKKLAAS